MRRYWRLERQRDDGPIASVDCGAAAHRVSGVEAMKRRHPMAFHMNWLRLIRFLTQYVAPGLATVVVAAEITGWLLGAPVLHSLTHAYHYVLLIVFSLLTV